MAVDAAPGTVESISGARAKIGNGRKTARLLMEPETREQIMRGSARQGVWVYSGVVHPFAGLLHCQYMDFFTLSPYRDVCSSGLKQYCRVAVAGPWADFRGGSFLFVGVGAAS